MRITQNDNNVPKGQISDCVNEHSLTKTAQLQLKKDEVKSISFLSKYIDEYNISESALPTVTHD